MKPEVGNPFARMGAYAACYMVGIALAVYGGAPGVVGTLLAGAPLVVFFHALFRRAK